MPAAVPSRRFLFVALVVAGVVLTFAAIRASRNGQRDASPPVSPVAGVPIPAVPSSKPSPQVDGPEIPALVERGDLTVPQKIEALLAAVPGASEEDRLTALQCATELIPDEDHPKYRLRLLQLADTPELRDLIAHDALSRGEEIGLPVVLDILRLAPGDDERRDMRDLLEAYLEHDYGANADDWEQPLKNWLAEHAGEP